MKSNKEHRFENNPTEKKLHDEFKKLFDNDGISSNTLSAIVFGWKDATQTIPNNYLSSKEEDVCINIIQWLGSPVGQGFLEKCGFVKSDNK